MEYTHVGMQEYLKPESKLTIKEKQDIFKMRARMIDIKENMKGNYVNFNCEACKLKGINRKETQKHVYKCSNLIKEKEKKSTKKYLETKQSK